MKLILQFAARVFRRLAFWCQRLGTSRYYVDDIPRRDVLLVEMLNRLKGGAAWAEVIRDRRALAHGERIAEYTFVYDLLRKTEPDRILDVGCVLNNSTFDQFIPGTCDMSFLNPATEPICRSRATYFRRPLAEFAERQYRLVTCLSTLEHIGFDNTRYGTELKDEGWDWPRAISCIVENVELLSRLVAPGGSLIVSFPYGRKEFVRLPPDTGPRVWQVLHPDHVRRLRESPALGGLECIFVRLGATGWEIVEEDAEFRPYGEVSCGASGLLLLKWERVATSRNNIP